MQYGQFIEYLCDLVPGIWSEKLYDGNFEGLSQYKFDYVIQKDNREKPWYPSGATNRAEYKLDRDNPVNGETCEKITVPNGSKCTVGISQDGLSLDPTKPCRLSLWLKTTGTDFPVRIRLQDGTVELAKVAFQPKQAWTRFEAVLEPKAKSDNATITIEFQGPGSLSIDAASLKPTQSVGGWRPDVVEALRRLKPGVIRLGGSVMDDPNLGAFEWKETIGDPDRRRPFRAWGGLQPTGPGIEEFVQLCEAVNAEPLICIRIREKTPKDAAEEIEYFNGSISTPMGALRAKNGHPLPYRVKYWQVGNEQGGEAYERRLADFCKAMRQVDPSIKILSSFPSEGIIKNVGSMLDYVCPHHYECDNLPAENDDFTYLRNTIARLSPGKPLKLGITEWNTTAGDRGLKRARLWTLENALAIARYQNLMHRNCDLVEIANRSNLTNSFCSGIIQTDSHRIYMTPTYYAQSLYANFAGNRPLKIDPPAPLKAGLDVSATLSAQGNQVIVFAVNDSPDPLTKTLDMTSFGTLQTKVEAWTLGDRDKAGEVDVTNGFTDPARIVPRKKTIVSSGRSFAYDFPPYALTMLRFTK